MVHKHYLYYTIKSGWTYLAFDVNPYSKKIIGYAYGTSMTTTLAVEALKMPV